MQILSLEHVKLHWREDGDRDGRPIVFANSLGTDLRIWDKVLAQLPNGYRFIRFDKRGHGLSSYPAGHYTMDELTDDAEQLLEHLGINDCIFVGVSIGGMIGQNLAVRRPDLVARLILSNTATSMGDPQMWTERIKTIEKDGIDTLADSIMERWFSQQFLQRPELEAWRNMLLRTPAIGYVGCCAAIAATDLHSQTAGLKLPVLAIAGSEDQACSAEAVQDMANLIDGADFALLDGVGHLPSIETPERFSQLLSEFLDG